MHVAEVSTATVNTLNWAKVSVKQSIGETM